MVPSIICAYSGFDEEVNIYYAKGEGSYLYTNNDYKVLDGLSGMMNCNLGHSCESLIQNALKDLKSTSIVPAVGSESSVIAHELGENIRTILGKRNARSFFCSSGTEAVESCLYILFEYASKLNEGRKIIVSVEGSYHGSSAAARSFGGRKNEPHPLLEVFEKYAMKVPIWNSRGRYTVSNALKALIDQYGSDSIGGFILEPIMGLAGMIIPEPRDLQVACGLCKEYSIPICVDETITGGGRTGGILLSDEFDIDYDMVIMSKGLGAGIVSVSSVTIVDRLLQKLLDCDLKLLYGHTGSGAPFSMAIAKQVLDIVSAPEFLNKIIEKSAKLEKELINNISEKIIARLNMKGLCIGLNMGDESLASNVVSAAFNRGLRIRTVNENIILTPPLTISEDEIEELATKLGDVLHSI